MGAVVEFRQQGALPDGPHLRPHGRRIGERQQVKLPQIGWCFDKAGTFRDDLFVGNVPSLSQSIHRQVVHDQHLDDMALLGRQFKTLTHLFGEFAAAMHV